MKVEQPEGLEDPNTLTYTDQNVADTIFYNYRKGFNASEI